MYQVFLGYMPLPIAPSRIYTTVNGKNETIELFSGQDVNILKPTGLTEISFEFLIPHMAYPFATVAGQLANIVGNATGTLGYTAMEVAMLQYLEYLKTGKTSVGSAVSSLMSNSLSVGNVVDSLTGNNQTVTKGEPFQFIVADVGNSRISIKHNIKVTLEYYEIIEDAEDYGLDTLVAVTLKEYVPYSTKILNNNGKITKTRGK